MDVFLGRVTAQAMNYAIRSGITITTTYAIRECGRLLKETPRSQAREELMQLQLRLESKIRIISPAIDMIELISARGNTSLESAVSLTKEIRFSIQRLGTRLSSAATDEQLIRRKSSRAKSREETERGLRTIIAEIKALLLRIEDAVPLINLAITTSGINLSTSLSASISPSRLLQASTFLTAADTNYAAQPGRRTQVGPIWTLSMYMLFAGHAWRPVDEEGVRETTWKEVVHKARLTLMRVPVGDLFDLPGEQTHSVEDYDKTSIPGEGKASEFAYQLVLIEDLDDDRVHTFEDEDTQPGPFGDVASAGIRDLVPIHEISKIFYADTGKILNIGTDDGENNPVLLLKRDVHAEPPRRMLRKSQVDGYYAYDDSEINGFHDEQSEIDVQIQRETTPNAPPQPAPATDARWRLPADLDPEWMAFEVFAEVADSESDPEESSEPSQPPTSRADSVGPSLTGALSNLALKSPSNSPQPNAHNSLTAPLPSTSPPKQSGPQIKTSLSLLEMLLKLTALQQFRQESHLAIEDELLNFFLEDSATAGVGADKDMRQRVRRDARRRVGFDPYDESPAKRRGEFARPAFDQGAFQGRLPEHENDGGYEYDRTPTQTPEGAVHPSIEEPYSSPGAAPPSSPSPMQQTPARFSAPPSSRARPAAESRMSPLATPPSTAKSRQAYAKPIVRSNGSVGGSPLVREIGSWEDEDEGDAKLEE